MDPQRFDQLVHPPRGDPGQVTVRDHGDQRSLGAFAALQQPLREVRARAQFRDRDVDRADPGVQIAVPVTVALRDPARRGLAPFGADHGIHVRGQQGVDDGLQQVTHQIRRRVRQRFAEHAGRDAPIDVKRALTVDSLGMLAGRWFGEEAVHLSRDRAFEAPNNVLLRQAFGGAAFDVGAGWFVVAHPDQRDRIEGIVCGAVAATVQSMSVLSLAG